MLAHPARVNWSAPETDGGRQQNRGYSLFPSAARSEVFMPPSPIGRVAASQAIGYRFESGSGLGGRLAVSSSYTSLTCSGRREVLLCQRF
jgi:hypothetical protein